MTALVSVVIPCYKQAVFLSEALDSVLSQTYSNWECVIVNDGSPDCTEEVAKRYLNKDSRFSYVFQNNAGLSSARNTGILYSHGEYILPLDADDLIKPTYLEKAVEHFELFPNTKLVYCKAYKFGDEYGCWNLPYYNYDSFIWANCIFCTAMYRRSDYDRTNGYNPNMLHGNEDWDFYLSLLKRDDIVFQLDEVLFYYRVKKKSMTTEMHSYYLEDSLRQLYRNHHDIYKPFIIANNENIIINRKNEQELKRLIELKKEYNRLTSSHAYRLGKFLLKPFSWVRRIVEK